MAAATILKIAFLAITHRTIVWFQRNFARKSRTACRQRPRNKKLQIFKIQDGGRPPFWKLLNRYISVQNCHILMKFGNNSRYWTRYSHVNRNWNFLIYDGDGLHLENRFLGHNSLNGCPISAKFRNRKQNDNPTKATWQKLQIFKIQDGGRPPFWKPLNHHISVKILSDFDSIWCTTADVEPDEILKSTVAVF